MDPLLLLDFKYNRQWLDSKYQLRKYIVQWIYSISRNYNLNEHTFFMALDLFDRYIFDHAFIEELTTNIKLVGASCLFLTTKFHDTQALSIRIIQSECNREYTRNQIKNMEFRVLEKFEFKICNQNSVFNKLYQFMCTRFNEKDILECMKHLKLIVHNYEYIFYNISDLCICVIYIVTNVQIDVIDQICMNFVNHII